MLRGVGGKVYDLLDEPTGLVMIDVEGKNCLIDTGSPWLLGDPGTSLSFGGVTYSAQKASPLLGLSEWSLSAIREACLSKHKLDFVVGTEVLSQHPFIIDRQKGTFTLGEIKKGLRAFGGLMVQGRVDSRPASFLVDTGAAVTFVSTGVDWSVEPEEETFRDFYPLQGWFEVPQRRLTVEALGHRFENSKVVDLPSSLDPKGLTGGRVTAILGMSDVLREGCLGFDLQRGIISFEANGS